MSQTEKPAPSISIPEDFPIPTFTFGQKVYLKDSDNTRGTIIGIRSRGIGSLQQIPHSYEYAFYARIIDDDNDWYNEDQLSIERWPEEER